ncbi:SWIB/MDM2 domain-containing protein [Suillus paluster]|uniref:SWIB/MDM2 domain-containing protein n=1 Tax=Suillus paluster TaxID=48578 RepID=UPI001B882EBF|nr:SWIB/MDM2 domain-containing protein [Suillus paluster]KAG1740895.1 SWIB/MDM2 domain-containing protein [Suillus paluster]
MSFNLKDLEGPITLILTAPGVDLSTISAKRVRQKLLEDTALGLTTQGLKKRRTEVDTMISNIFENISRQAQADDSKRKRDEETDEATEQDDQGEVSEEQDEQEDAVEEQDAEASEEEDEKPPPPKKKKSAAKSVEEADAELARKLASELNSRSRRGASNGASTTPKKRKTKKSAAVVDSGGENDDEDEEKPKKKRSGGARGGFAKEYILSESLSVVVGVDKLSRPQVVKKLWEYIRGHELQNPSNRREIMCDDNMRAVFGTEKVDMFRMNKVLGRHLHAQ